MKIILLSILLYIASTLVTNAQAPTVQWQKSLGGTLGDVGNSFGRQPTPDGGSIICGGSYSNDGDVTGHHGTAAEMDVWIVKLDSLGIIDWQQSYGGSLEDYGNNIINTSDGGYIFCGYTFSNNGDVTGNHSSGDCWVVKLDSVGGIEWEHSYGGPGEDKTNSIQETSNGDFILLASTQAGGGDVTGFKGGMDFWLFKIENNGTLLWQKCLGGSGWDTPYDGIELTPDGGFVFSGGIDTVDGDVTFTNGAGDIWMVKTDSAGVIQWDKSFGGTGHENSHYIIATSDGGYFMGGQTFGPVSGDVTSYNAMNDAWVVKTDSVGNKLWATTLGGSNQEWVVSSKQTSDGGFLILSSTLSNDGDVSGNHGFMDFWLSKIDAAGMFQWQQCYGGSWFDIASDLIITNDGGILITGASDSNDGDVSGHHGPPGFTGAQDCWVVKLYPFATGIEENNNSIYEVNLFPNPVSSTATISFSLNETQTVSIKIYDITGREIKMLVSEKLIAGEHQINWNINQNKIDAGIYFVKIDAGAFSITRKLTVTK